MRLVQERQKDMGPAETIGDTHGICEECLAKLLPDNQKKSERE